MATTQTSQASRTHVTLAERFLLSSPGCRRLRGKGPRPSPKLTREVRGAGFKEKPWSVCEAAGQHGSETRVPAAKRGLRFGKGLLRGGRGPVGGCTAHRQDRRGSAERRTTSRARAAVCPAEVPIQAGHTARRGPGQFLCSQQQHTGLRLNDSKCNTQNT